jgi:hypothetical protein
MRNGVIFLSGLVIGAAAGFFGGRLYFGKKYQEQYENDVKAMEEYTGVTDKYARVEEAAEEEIEEKSNRSSGPLSPEKRKQIKEQLEKNQRETTRYATMYKGKKEDPAELEYPEEDVLDDEEEEETPEEEAHNDHLKNSNRRPRIISADAVNEMPPYYDFDNLYFYTDDETVCDDNDQVIDEPGHLIGDCLEKYNFADSDEKVIFVQNFELDTVYEIQKVFAAYGDSH